MIRTVISIALAYLPASIFAASPDNTQGVQSLHELNQCRKALTPSDTKIVSPCANRNMNNIVGVSKSELLKALGNPDFCLTSNNQVHPWQEKVCSTALNIGYMFYRLPEDMIGGGPQLVFTIGSEKQGVAVAWKRSQ